MQGKQTNISDKVPSCCWNMSILFEESKHYKRKTDFEYVLPCISQMKHLSL